MLNKCPQKDNNKKTMVDERTGVFFHFWNFGIIKIQASKKTILKLQTDKTPIPHSKDIN